MTLGLVLPDEKRLLIVKVEGDDDRQNQREGREWVGGTGWWYKTGG